MCTISEIFVVYLVLLRESELRLIHDFKGLNWEVDFFQQKEVYYQFIFQRKLLVCVIFILFLLFICVLYK